MTDKKRILVVDDDEEIVQTLAIVLNSLGYEVTGAGDGELGMEMQQQQPSDLMIVDLKMPNKDGFEMLKELEEAGVKAPAIVITGQPGDWQEGQAAKLGVKHFIRKPFDMGYLVECVERSLRVSAG